jgi:hypothetical protein
MPYPRIVQRLASLPLKAAFVWLCLCAPRNQAAAQPVEEAQRAQARDLGSAGIDDFEAGRHPEAAQKLDQAYTLFPVPTLGLWSARARVQVGRWLQAAERYKETIALSSTQGDSATQNEAKQEAKAELEHLLPRIPSFVLQLQHAHAAELQVLLDGVAIVARVSEPTPVDPGPHQLVATRGPERIEAKFSVAEGQRRNVRLEFQTRQEPTVPTPAAVPSLLASTDADTGSRSTGTLRALGISGVIVGAVGLATAGIAALVANHNIAACPTIVNGVHTCPNQWQLDNYLAAKTVTTVAFWAGAGTAVVGAVTWIAGSANSDEPEPEPKITWSVGPTSAAIKAAF